MFKKFVAAEHTSTQTPLKSSVQRATLKRVADQYADMAPETLEVVVPKKSQLIVVKWYVGGYRWLVPPPLRSLLVTD